jgi:sec-independent protein translocase protein TatB
MFGIGPTELIVILVIALLVLGPKRLPELASGLGKGLAEFRRATADINAELDEARRTIEEPAKDAARAAQPKGRVSRNTSAAAAHAQAEPTTPADSEGAETGSETDAEDDTSADPKAQA